MNNHLTCNKNFYNKLCAKAYYYESRQLKLKMGNLYE